MTRKPDEQVVSSLMRMIEDYRMAGGSQEHHVRKADLVGALLALVAKTHAQPCTGMEKLAESLTDVAYQSVRESVGLPAHSPSTDRVATVSNEIYWMRINADTPKGTKLWLINKAAGSATSGQSDSGKFFTHWHPLPRFRKDESDET